MPKNLAIKDLKKVVRAENQAREMKTDIYVSSLIWNSITYIIIGKKIQQYLENSCSISTEKTLEGRVGVWDEILKQMKK